MSEGLQNLITKSRAGFWMHTFCVFYFFLSQRSQRGSVALQMMWEDLTAGLIAQPQSFFPGPEKGERQAARPNGTPCFNSSRHMGSCIPCSPGPETRAFLPLPPRVQRHGEGLFRSPCSEPMVARHLLFPGFFIFCLGKPSAQLKSPLQSLSEVPLLLILLLPFRVSYSYMFPAS